MRIMNKRANKASIAMELKLKIYLTGEHEYEIIQKKGTAESF